MFPWYYEINPNISGEIQKGIIECTVRVGVNEMKKKMKKVASSQKGKRVTKIK